MLSTNVRGRARSVSRSSVAKSKDDNDWYIVLLHELFLLLLIYYALGLMSLATMLVVSKVPKVPKGISTLKLCMLLLNLIHCR